MNRCIGLAVLMLGLIVAGGCRDKAPSSAPIKPRADFAPEEFGIGKRHTGDTACNRQIDVLLEEIRRCYNQRGGESCQSLQQDHNQHIARLKNSVRCRR